MNILQIPPCDKVLAKNPTDKKRPAPLSICGFVPDRDCYVEADGKWEGTRSGVSNGRPFSIKFENIKANFQLVSPITTVLAELYDKAYKNVVDIHKKHSRHGNDDSLIAKGKPGLKMVHGLFQVSPPFYSSRL